MGWKPLGEHFLLDHEREPPAPGAEAAPPAEAPPPTETPPATGNFTPVDANAPLDSEATPAPAEPAAAAPPAPAPTITITAKRLKPGEAVPEYTGPAPGEVNAPTTTVEGFQSGAAAPSGAAWYNPAGYMSGVAPDAGHHTELSAADKKEYADFFKDPAKPPTAKQLEDWLHKKTGAYFGNAQAVIDQFKQTGEFSTDQTFVAPTESVDANMAAGHHFTNAALYDWSPEVAAALNLLNPNRPSLLNNPDDASVGQLWGVNADINRAQLERESQEHPTASAAGEVGGAVASGLAAGPLAEETALARIPGFVPVGVPTLEGAAYGSGSAGPGHRGEGAAAGAAAVPIMAAGARAVTGLGEAGYTAARGSSYGARARVGEQIAADRPEMAPTQAVDQAAADIADAHANNVPMMVADTGENVRSDAAAASRFSGVAKTLARRALGDRQAGLHERVTNAIERDLGPVANPIDTKAALINRAKAKAKPFYDRFYASLPKQSRAIDNLLNRPSMQSALKHAAKLVKEEGGNPTALGFKVDDEGNVLMLASGKGPKAAVTTYTPKTLDYIKRGMDEALKDAKNPLTGKLEGEVANAINNTRVSYLKVVDKLYRDYPKARAAYAGDRAAADAIEEGARAPNMTGNELQVKLRTMSPFERQMFAFGHRVKMADLIAEKGEKANIPGLLLGAEGGKKRAMLGLIHGGRGNLNRFTKTLEQEGEGFQTFGRALTGSPTSPNEMDNKSLGAVASGLMGFASGHMSAAGAARHVFGLMGIAMSKSRKDKFMREMSAMLTNPDGTANLKLLGQVRAEMASRGARRRIYQQGSRATARGVQAYAQPRQ